MSTLTSPLARLAGGDTRVLFASTSRSVIHVLVVLLLAEALFEDWLVVLLERNFADGTIAGGLTIDALVKGGRNVAYVAVAAAAVVRVATAYGLRAFLRPIDLAFAALVVALVVAGTAGGSSLLLLGHGLFVYVRGAIIFYAVRALAPNWAVVRPLLLVLGGGVLLHVAVAVAQALIGPPAYQAVGFTDLTWAYARRAQGLFMHPNHLGHIAGLGALFVLALNLRSANKRWWVVFALLASGVAVAQSRESLAALAVGIVALYFLQAGRARQLALALLVLVVATSAAWSLQPGAWDTLAQRIRGVLAAVEVPSGETPTRPCDPAVEICTPQGTPGREIRVLYYQQGVRLWLASPVFGYGVGQFGGGVASQHNPEWYANPRFGPDGFDMHGFQAAQVDSFWLHLLVETGVLGFSAYVLWLVMLGLPAVRRARQRAARAFAYVGAASIQASSRAGVDRFAPAAILFGALIAGLSPALEDPLFPPILFAGIALAWVPWASVREPVAQEEGLGGEGAA